MKIVSCMKTMNIATLKKETPAKPVIAGKLMLKGQNFQGVIQRGRWTWISSFKSIFFRRHAKGNHAPQNAWCKNGCLHKKVCYLSRNLCSFSKTKGIVPTGVMWHEEISGRKAKDVAITFAKVIWSAQYRDVKHFIFWFDNYSRQNKNWVLFTMFCYLLNVSGSPESITIKYFEKGHTFMSADSFHHQTEKKMRSKKKCLRFRYFWENHWIKRLHATNDGGRFLWLGK